MKKTLFLVVLCVVTIAIVWFYNNLKKEGSVFPEVKSISDLSQTDFVPALENNIDLKTNTAYAATLLMAWDEIINHYKEIRIEEDDVFGIFNSSKRHKGALNEGEYKTSVSIDDTSITAKAYFRKSLPFELALDRYESGLSFLGSTVDAFGFYGYNESTGIGYYNTDDDFALKLYPKDYEHEIVLMKTDFSGAQTLADVVELYNSKTETFNANRTEKNSWRYYLQSDDFARIPIIEFNLEKNFSEIEGSVFIADKDLRRVAVFYQRNAFVLNEKGAEVESYAEITEEALEEPEENEDLPEPKALMFDKQYVIFLKRKDNPNPYFAMYVANTELMSKP